MRRSRTLTALLALATAAGVLAGCSTLSVSRSTNDAPSGTDWSPAAREIRGLTVLAQSDADGLRLHTTSGAKTFLPGVNLGSTTPGHQPGEVGGIDAATYRGWLTEMAATGIRVVRVYTLLPPAFYDELARHNRAHERNPIYLVQGAYLPDEDYATPERTLWSPEVDDAFGRELADLSAAVHGDLTRPAAPGRAGGTWGTDVSPWLASWVIGVEWDPEGVRLTDATPRRPYAGRFFAATAEATATESWITHHMDDLATAEAARGVSVPIAAVNWPTTDPLDHPTEPLASEDLVSVDPLHMLPTAAWPGGTFASFHAYPYYPDFQRYEPGYDATTWRGKPDRYAGYLAALQEHVAGVMPLAVTEFGVPSSLGSAHAGTNGRDQGAHSEQQAMAMDADMMAMMADRGIAAAFVFAWEDEWFKRTWNTVEHQDPERRQLWHDPLTNEQYFGLVATDPGPIPDGAVEAAPSDGAIEYVHAWVDHSWVHLEVTGRDEAPTRLTLSADVVPGGEAGDPTDYRVLIDRAEDTATAQVRRALDPIRLDTDESPYRPDEAEPWHEYWLLTNRSNGEHPMEHERVGALREGSWDPADPAYDSRATWRVDEERRTLHLRLPWSMVGMADPSQRLALGEGRPAPMVAIDGIGLTVAADDATERLDLTWPTWTRVDYTARPKAGLGALEKEYRRLAP